MIPNLNPGDEILVDPRAYRLESPQVGDIVVAYRPDRVNVTIIKRISAITDDGNLFLLGDNPASSTDSRTFGLVPSENIISKVTSKFA